MPHRRPILAPLALAGLLAFVGCTHNHYYYGPGGMGTVAQGPTVVGSSPTVVAAKPKKGKPVVVAGSYCDVPQVVTSDPVVVTSAPKSRSSSTVVTRPGSPPANVVTSGAEVEGSDSWRRRSPESMATTRVTGSYDDDLTR